MAASIADRAYEQLAHAIETCRLPPGAPFNERGEAARLGMSRTPLRQALHRLELEGLVVTRPKRGTYVAPLNAIDIQENMALREAVEVAMAHRVLLEGRAVDFTALAAMLADQMAAIERSDHLHFLTSDEQFHQLLLSCAGNQRAIEAVDRAWRHINRARYLVPMTPEQMRQAHEQHGDILEAIRTEDVDRTRWAIRRHLEEPMRRNLAELADRHPEAFSNLRQ